MKGKRFSEKQVISVTKESEAGMGLRAPVSVQELAPQPCAAHQ